MDQKWLRVIIFAALSVGSIWLLSSKVEQTKGIDSPGGKTVTEVLGEKIEQVIPDSVKKQFEEITNKAFKKSSQVIEEAEIVKEIKLTVDRAIEEVEGFPEKQKKEIKKEVIRQVCDELMRENQ